MNSEVQMEELQHEGIQIADTSMEDFIVDTLMQVASDQPENAGKVE